MAAVLDNNFPTGSIKYFTIKITEFKGFYLEMVHVALRPHHQFTGWDGLTTSTASATVSK